MKRANSLEKKTAKERQGKLTKGSGRGKNAFQKGDIRTAIEVIDTKAVTTSFTVNANLIKKMQDEINRSSIDSIPVIKIVTQIPYTEIAVLPWADLKGLLEEVEFYRNGK